MENIVKGKSRKQIADDAYYQRHKESLKIKRMEFEPKQIQDIKTRTKEYYNKNKETVNVKRCIKFECYCGGFFSANNKQAHFRTNKHANWTPIV
jgi:hypothetical protein